MQTDGQGLGQVKVDEIALSVDLAVLQHDQNCQQTPADDKQQHEIRSDGTSWPANPDANPIVHFFPDPAAKAAQNG